MWQRQYESILRENGLDQYEYQILNTIFERHETDLASLGNSCVARYCSFDALEPFLEAAIRCHEKGWVRELTQEDIDEDRERCLRSPIPYNSGYLMQQPGLVDFTKTGYLIHERVCIALTHIDQDRDPYHKDPYQASLFAILANEDHSEISFYSALRSNCFKLIADFIDDLEENGVRDESGRLVSELFDHGQIEEIGAWHPNPFITLDQGYCVPLTLRKELDP